MGKYLLILYNVVICCGHIQLLKGQHYSRLSFYFFQSPFSVAKNPKKTNKKKTGYI